MKISDIKTEQVLRACHAFHKVDGENRMPVTLLIKEYNAPEKVIFRAMERDLRNGFIDYGTSLQTAWVTEKGYLYLDILADAESSNCSN